MDTIRGYLNNMFNSLPRTEQTFKLKQDLLASMEEKYYELKKEGKSENEAVGIVISEFGNIDELIDELGITVGERIRCFLYLLRRIHGGIWLPRRLAVLWWGLV